LTESYSCFIFRATEVARMGDVSFFGGAGAPRSLSRLLCAAAMAGLAMLGCLAGPPSRGQASPVAMSMNPAQIVDESENIVLARVTGVRAEPHPRFQNLNTAVVLLEVIEPLKGSLGAELGFRQYVADIFESKSTLGYRVGEEIVLFLRKPSADGLTSPVGFEQGRFVVWRDTAGNRVVRNGVENAGLFDGIGAASPGLNAAFTGAPTPRR
jgi:hypothetical protein